MSNGPWSRAVEVVSPLRPVDALTARQDGRAVSARPAVLDALRAKLGWRWKAGDHTGFTSALAGAYQIEELQGIRLYRHRPSGYAIGSDVIGVGGAQFILLERLRPTINNARTVIQTLEPLRVAYDPELFEMRRSNLDAELQNLLEQAESSDRFDVGLFDTFFISLFADELRPWDEFVEEFRVDRLAPAGLLHAFEQEGGFILEDAANRSEEETVLRWQGMVADLVGAYLEYLNYRPHLVPRSETPYIGPRFADIERELAVMQQTLSEFQSVMSAYLFEDADWDAQLINVNGVDVPFKRFLTWAEAFPAEASDRLRDGGVPGALSLRLALERNRTVFAAAAPGEGSGFPEAYNESPLLASTHGELLQSMDNLIELLRSFEVWQQRQDERRTVAVGEAREIAAAETRQIADRLETLAVSQAEEQHEVRETLRSLRLDHAALLDAVTRMSEAAEAREAPAAEVSYELQPLADGSFVLRVTGADVPDDAEAIGLRIERRNKRLQGKGTRRADGVIEAIFAAPGSAGSWQVFVQAGDQEWKKLPEPLEISGPWA